MLNAIVVELDPEYDEYDEKIVVNTAIVNVDDAGAGHDMMYDLGQFSDVSSSSSPGDSSSTSFAIEVIEQNEWDQKAMLNFIVVEIDAEDDSQAHGRNEGVESDTPYELECDSSSYSSPLTIILGALNWV
ncbi:hypothetical protein AX15_000187 [Amanita polypyramis BW_CC]|nr:hypothetical protein AX15_000187 [Amanita polypyramis BW_CC]